MGKQSREIGKLMLFISLFAFCHFSDKSSQGFINIIPTDPTMSHSSCHSNLPPGWNPPPTPYQLSPTFFGDPTMPKARLQGLLCTCGEEIGEVVEGGKEMVGWWRITFKPEEQPSLEARCHQFGQMMKQRFHKLLEAISYCEENLVEAKEIKLRLHKIMEAHRDL